MTEALLAHEPVIRLAAFAGLLAALVAWEWAAPRRPLQQGRWRRWPGNLGIAALNTLLLRLVLPTAAVGVAVAVGERGWGAMNLAGLPYAVAVVLGFAVLDLAIYGQHVAFHRIGPLWRLHRMHHADLDIDVTTGARFHPVEILLSMGIKLALIVAFGIPAVAVLLFEVVLNATSMFNHSNIALPGRVDRVLRRVVVTPDMHRVHHSVIRRETDSNFGFNFPWWDRLFGTYRDQPEAGHLGMTIGLPFFRDPRELRLDRLLLQPLRRAATTAPPTPSRALP